ncbi:hypothetical protein BDV93DRAFT_513852 [Ceratobasidium sp. AG-I]|nr:hypothetical protein BDV93DRAFT_513852 [Ceratobasidium sp. AG-I]
MDPLDNILKGAFGMDLVISCFTDCVLLLNLSSSNLFLTGLKIGQLTALVHGRVICIASTPLAVNQEEDAEDAYEQSYDPAHNQPSKSGDEGHTEHESNGPTVAQKQKGKDAENGLTRKKKQKGQLVTEDKEDSPNLGVEEITKPTGNKPGQVNNVRRWALSNFHPSCPTLGTSNVPTWSFNWKYRT